MRNVTTLTKILDNDPTVMELDSAEEIRELFKKHKKRIPKKIFDSKYMIVLKKFVNSQTFQPTVLFAMTVSDGQTRALETPLYYAEIGLFIEARKPA
jgi:hypothetical protein